MPQRKSSALHQRPATIELVECRLFWRRGSRMKSISARGFLLENFRLIFPKFPAETDLVETVFRVSLLEWSLLGTGKRFTWCIPFFCLQALQIFNIWKLKMFCFFSSLGYPSEVREISTDYNVVTATSLWSTDFEQTLWSSGWYYAHLSKNCFELIKFFIYCRDTDCRRTACQQALHWHFVIEPRTDGQFTAEVCAASIFWFAVDTSDVRPTTRVGCVDIRWNVLKWGRIGEVY